MDRSMLGKGTEVEDNKLLDTNKKVKRRVIRFFR